MSNDMTGVRDIWKHRITVGERIVWTVGILMILGLLVYSLITEGHV